MIHHKGYKNITNTKLPAAFKKRKKKKPLQKINWRKSEKPLAQL